MMKTLPIEIQEGVLRLPNQASIPVGSRLAVIVLEKDDLDADLQVLADAGGAFGFLREEPDLYSDADVLPGRQNPRFGGGR